MICRWVECPRQACDDPLSVFCGRHVGVMRPFTGETDD